MKILFLIIMITLKVISAANDGEEGQKPDRTASTRATFVPLEELGIESNPLGKRVYLCYVQLNRMASPWNPQTYMTVDNSALWETGIFTTTGEKVMQVPTLYRTKVGTNSDAVKEFFKKPSAIDCTTAVFIVATNIIAQIASRELNRISNFGTIYSPTIMPFLQRSQNLFPVEIGEFGSFANIKTYGLMHHPETDRNSTENVFCIGRRNGEPMYMGFGKLFEDGPKTRQEILDSLFTEFQGVYVRFIGSRQDLQAQLSLPPVITRGDWDEEQEEAQKQALILLLSDQTIRDGATAINQM